MDNKWKQERASRINRKPIYSDREWGARTSINGVIDIPSLNANRDIFYLTAVKRAVVTRPATGHPDSMRRSAASMDDTSNPASCSASATYE